MILVPFGVLLGQAIVSLKKRELYPGQIPLARDRKRSRACADKHDSYTLGVGTDTTDRRHKGKK
jgi:hypothetical protein